jgi:hypothetical protein
MTRYVGELIQHDASYHLWSPPAQKKWYLITSRDDYSRFILYAAFLEKETSWAHTTSLKSVFLRYGMPFSYYVDSHSIFRFVRGRDAFWQKHFSLTHDAIPQWRQVLDDCNVKVTDALYRFRTTEMWNYTTTEIWDDGWQQSIISRVTESR